MGLNIENTRRSEYVFHNIEVSNATYTFCSSQSCKAVCINGVYKANASMRLLYSYRFIRLVSGTLKVY